MCIHTQATSRAASTQATSGAARCAEVNQFPSPRDIPHPLVTLYFHRSSSPKSPMICRNYILFTRPMIYV